MIRYLIEFKDTKSEGICVSEDSLNENLEDFEHRSPEVTGIRDCNCRVCDGCDWLKRV
jgi:hypothetical protein